jgi:uncharacterized protein
MLTFNVLTELRQPIGSVNEYELAESRLGLDDESIEELRGTLRLLRSDRGLLVTVKATGTMPGECSRCARPVKEEIEIDFEEEYVPILDPNTSSMVYLAADDESFRINKRYDLDLREGLRQYILISEPAKPLCRPDCRGLCPRCGADLNEGPHDCQEPTDERWSALAALNYELDEGN